jgi:3-methyladenine DNA glycosylase AlkD
MKTPTSPSGKRAKITPAISPERFAREALAELRRKAHPKWAEGAQRYFKDAVKVMGVNTPDLRFIGKTFFFRVKDAWTIDQAVALCDILYQNPNLEAKGMATLILAKFVPGAGPKHFQKMRSWFERDLLDNWASTDVFCGEVLSPYLERFPEFREELKDWTQAGNMWVRRASAVALVTPARRGKNLDLAYDIVGRLLDNTEDLMHKACGWLLREAGKTDMTRLEKFLLANGPKIPRTTVRYALERFDDKKRRSLLIATQG